MTVFSATYLLLVSVVLSILTFHAWTQRREQLQTQGLPAKTVLVSLALALISFFLAAVAGLHVTIAATPPVLYDRWLARVYASGFLLSSMALLFAVAGLWRPSRLRWHAPLVALGAMMLWLFLDAGE